MLTAVIVGLIVGAVAKLLMPGKDPGGIIITILIGIAGAIIGTFLGRSLGFYAANEGAGIIVSVIGAMILLFLYRVLLRRRAVP
jgi:uncharacterized membrane protein YeaQ/YmgE (transglycosylase-associated protein family)